MPYIKIANLGPIKECRMDIENFTVLTGQQASGKSTIAKCIYFCRTIKDDIRDEILKSRHSISEAHINNAIYSRLRNKFLQIFGTSLAMDIDMKLEYYYSDNTFVTISLRNDNRFYVANYKFLYISFSDNINKYIKQINKETYEKEDIKSELNQLFYDEYDSIFIPAGRSLITIFSSQLNYLFATMDDEQKRSIDYCTQKYIEYILKIKPIFSEGLIGLAQNSLYKTNADYNSMTEYINIVKTMEKLISKVLKGNYIYANGEERLYLTDEKEDSDKYVKINFTSSGQQETVWLFNILFYIMVNKTKAFIILEEPEAHLYPDAQKITSEILALMSNCSCQLLITTHSPYILGSLNNLIYAEYIANKTSDSSVDNLADKLCRIKNHCAYQVKNGVIESCIEDTPERLIKNEVIDGASEEINELYDRLFDIDMMDGE